MNFSVSKYQLLFILIAIVVIYWLIQSNNASLYLGDWGDGDRTKHLTLFKDHTALYGYGTLGNFSCDWSEKEEALIVIHCDILNNKTIMTFKTSSGDIGYLDDKFIMYRLNLDK